MPSQLSRVEMGQFRAAFKRYTSSGEEVIRVSDIPNVMNSLGITPSQQQDKDVVAKVNSGTKIEETGTITDETINFQNFLSAISSDENILKDVLSVIAGHKVEKTSNMESQNTENKENEKKSDDNISEREMREAFQFCDKDGNGFITADEVHQVMADFGVILSLEEINEKIQEADTDGDNQINYEEFINISRGGFIPL